MQEVADGDPGQAAAENARRKAEAVQGALVLGADTIVALDGAILRKPAGELEAREGCGPSAVATTTCSAVCA